MIGLRGQRLGTLRFLHDGHMYHHDARYYDNDEEYICFLLTSQIFKCQAIASVDKEGDVEVIVSHTHCRRFTAQELRKQEMMTVLKRRAVISNDEPNQIFNAVSRDFKDIVELINPVAGRAVIIRARALQRPPMPQSVHQVGPMLDRYLPAAEIYRGEIQVDDGSIAIIFGSQRMLERLNNAVELFVDGTFQGLPALFILCERRTTSMYEKIWQFIMDRSPDFRNNLKYISGDFEKASIQAIRNVMPWIIYRGYWFHFTRAVTRRWRRLHLNRAPELVLHLTWVLPLVPAHLFREVFAEIRRHARLIEQEYPRIMFFIAYPESYWLPQAASVSTRNSVVRTNNIAEAFNRQLVTRLGERLNLIIKDEEMKWMRLEQSHDMGAERRAYQASVDTRIINYQMSLDRGRFTVAEFLHTVGLQRVNVAIEDANIRLDGEDINLDDEMPVLRDLADPVGVTEIPQNDFPPARIGRNRGHRVARRTNFYNLLRAAARNNLTVIGQPAARRARDRPPRATINKNL